LLWEPGSEAVEVVVEDLGYGCEGTGQELSGGWYLFAGTENFWLVGPDRQVRKVPTRQPNYFCDSPGVIAFDDDPRGPSALLLVDERDDEGLEWTILYRIPVPDGPLEALASWRKNALSISPVGRGPGVAFLRAHDEPHGNEVWRTDGTPEGTHLWLDVLPGKASSEPSDLLPVAGGYVLAAHSPETGRELWFSDGTAGGTRRLTDLAPGHLSSFPRPLVFDGSGDLLFTADDASDHGYELWRIRELDPP
jgi:ELWxxDGT repeat protein